MSTLVSILTCRCPKCHKGNLFTEKNPFKLSAMTKMPKNCYACGQPTEPEVGFYYGAMYVSYGLCVAVCGLVFIMTDFILDLPPYSFMVINTIALLLLWPVIFRYARVLYIYLFVSYDSQAEERFHQTSQNIINDHPTL